MEQIEKTPVRVKVAAIVRDAILSGELASGTELSLTDTANRLRVSRTPVREAFQQLESEGLIELRMNRGAVVKPIDEEFITDHFDMRMLLEGEAVFRAIRNGMDPGPLAALQKAITASGEEPPASLYDGYNQEFHQILWTGAKSRKLYAFLETLWNGPSYSRAVGSDVDHAKSIEEHGRMIQCFARGDAEQGREVMRRHIERSMIIVLNAVKARQGAL